MSLAPHILVTGGAGFIGSHASKALARRGFVPVAYDNLTRGHRDLVKFGPLEEGEIADQARVRAVLEKYRPVAVMHFAAFAYIGESVENPAMYHRNNVGASTAFLKALLDYKPLPLVFSSTCAIYGIPDRLPITEDFPQRPINPYGETKLIVEGMLGEMGRTHKLPWVALRYFNAAGSDPEGEIGEIHDPETHIIPLALMAARSGTTFKILGQDYETPDGTCIRDFIHVTDIADAHVRALDYLMKGGASVALNLANTRGYSVKEVIAECERVSGRSIVCEVAPRRPGDPAMLVGSAKRAVAVLGWTPQRSALETQIADAWRWLCARDKR